MPAQQKRAIVVLGMHRSGTSAVAGAVNLLGAERPVAMPQGGPSNLLAYFEAYGVIHVNDWPPHRRMHVVRLPRVFLGLTRRIGAPDSDGADQHLYQCGVRGRFAPVTEGPAPLPAGRLLIADAGCHAD